MFSINPIDKKNPEIKLVLFELGYSISKKIETVINKRLEMYIKFFMVIFVKFSTNLQKRHLRQNFRHHRNRQIHRLNFRHQSLLQNFLGRNHLDRLFFLFW